MNILGKHLKQGDTIAVWWGAGRDTITELAPYQGPLRHLWDDQEGAQLAAFALNPVGMTIEPMCRYTVLHRQG